MFETVIWIIFGVTIGSFVNVCLDRLPLQFADDEKRQCLLNDNQAAPLLKEHLLNRTLSIFSPARSFCFSCGSQIHWFENIPLFSFLLNRACCRNCSTKLDSRLFWTEFLHGLWYAGLGWFFTGWITAFLFSINFSFLWILGYCWPCRQLQKSLLFAAAVLLTLNFIIYFS
ncbi:MAG: prepilin peptidase [SAR324 cluster bacterium]|nr:prepilin peptidase [SAR324 cluster bacterium]MBL7035539.1 prepilin peptidase [SAR324 cluster bacterium]